ncbi:MAG: hypothetical protein AAGI53_03960 [Planctomycetota bacterium]
MTTPHHHDQSTSDTLDDPILQDPVLSSALKQLSELPDAPDVSSPVLLAVDSRRRFMKRRRRDRVRRVRYSIAAGVVVLVGMGALLHRIAPNAVGLQAMEAPVNDVAEAIGADTLAGRERLAEVATGFGDVATAFIGGGSLGLSTGPLDDRLGVPQLDITLLTASGEVVQFASLDAIEADAGAASEAFAEQVSTLIEQPLAASQSPTAAADDSALQSLIDGVLPSNIPDPSVSDFPAIDLDSIISTEPTPGPSQAP